MTAYNIGKGIRDKDMREKVITVLAQSVKDYEIVQ